MASPHIAGLAALYLGERPNATPAEIKSAMMTTAYDTVDDAGDPVTDPFAQGAGHVDPTRFFEPGLLYLNGLAGLVRVPGRRRATTSRVDPIDASDLNLASIGIGSLTAPQTITRTVTVDAGGHLHLLGAGPRGHRHGRSSRRRSTFGAAGEAQTFSVTFTPRPTRRSTSYATGSLTWTSGDTAVRSPIAVQPRHDRRPGVGRRDGRRPGRSTSR